MTTHMIVALPFIPYLAALLILFIPAGREKFLRGLTLSACGLCLLTILLLTQNFDRSFSGFQFVHAWDCFAEMGIRYQVGLDGINLVFCLLHAIVAFAGAFIAAQTKSRLKEYLFYYLLLTGSMFAVFTVLNVFFLYVFYEMTLIPVFVMIGIAGASVNKPSSLPKDKNITVKERGAMHLALYMTAGAVVALFAIFNLYDILGPDFLDLTKTPDLLADAALLTPEIQKWLAALLIVGFGVMTSLWPLHSWSPSVYSVAPASLSMLHAGVKIGPYFLLRIAIAYLPVGFQFWAPTLAALASIGIIYGGFAAIRQKNLKTMAAFSSISHMGYVFIALAAMTSTSLSGGVLLIFAHGIMTACLFGLIGHLDQTGTDRINAFGGLGKSLPFFAVCFIATSFASAGIPGFANFPAEILVFISSWKIFPVAVICGVAGVLITAIYMMRAAHAICFGQPHFASEPLAQPADITGMWNKAPFLILLAVLVFFGFFPGSLLSILQPAIERLL